MTVAEAIRRHPNVQKDAHGRLFIRSQDAVHCRGQTQLSSARVQELLRAQGVPYKKGLEERVLDFVGSDESVDRMGDIIRVDGWETDEFDKNPVVLLNHNYFGLPVGRALEVKAEQEEAKGEGKKKSKKQLRFSVLFADEETSKEADTVYRLYRGGFMSAVSVGFIPLATEDLTEKERTELGVRGRVFSRQKLLELSCVTVPANPNALQVAYQKGVAEATELLPFVRQEAFAHPSRELRQLLSELEVRAQLLTVDDGWSYPVRDSRDFEEDSFTLQLWEGVDSERPIYLAVGTLKPEDEDEDENEDESVKSYDWSRLEGLIKDLGECRSPACRQSNETKKECMSRKIPEILEEDPDVSQEQAVAIAASICDKPCDEKGEKQEEPEEQEKPTQAVQSVRFLKDDDWTVEEVAKWMEVHLDDVLKVSPLIQSEEGIPEAGEEEVAATAKPSEIKVVVEVRTEGVEKLREEIGKLRKLLEQMPSASVASLNGDSSSGSELEDDSYYASLLELNEKL